ncbi:helix-turn-helix domain-containing protein [Deinococcus sp. YIM 134068]|uniref:helix-turn-helix domain-containing protein n=1 Tax=Deinococcus lichenicola TaxID=3118910 RepID=UPI002F935DBA
MTAELAELQAAWSQVEALAHDAITPIENDEQHARALGLLEPVWHAVGEDPAHPLASLMTLMIERIATYEERHYPLPEADGAAMLAFYMDGRELTQSQVAAGTGISQGIISRLLNRKRPFTAEHARILGRYFEVDPGVFL